MVQYIPENEDRKVQNAILPLPQEFQQQQQPQPQQQQEHKEYTIKQVFRYLTQQNILSRMPLACCQSCSLSELHKMWERNDRTEDGYVFFHDQSIDLLVDSGQVYLSFGIFDNDDEVSNILMGKKICNAFQDFGFNVEWNEDPSKNILIQNIQHSQIPDVVIAKYDAFNCEYNEEENNDGGGGEQETEEDEEDDEEEEEEEEENIECSAIASISNLRNNHRSS
jgi:hypothetical protein